ncbi:MAG: hypothetical protein LBV72_05000 [Tannerella sp.]|jgi:hypothetical protein|nr:hypothetical protein [Tannerella sp.]
MKKDDLLYDKFIEIIKGRIPEKGKLVNDLIDLLGIEKEGIYRRLRGDVPFSFFEVTKISREYSISLDSIVGNFNVINRSFNVKLLEFLAPKDFHISAISDYTFNLKSLVFDLDSESGSISTMIPIALCIRYKPLYKFYMYKWYIEFRSEDYKMSYSDINIDKRLEKVNEEFVLSVRNSPNSVYIFDELFILYFVKDIKYFEDIKLLTKEEISVIKASLHLFLNDLERYAIKGQFDEGGKVNIYISNIHFEGNLNYINSKQYKFAIIRAFTLNDIYSTDEIVCAEMKKWCLFLKRASTLISQSSELKRIEFFGKQRELVEML